MVIDFEKKLFLAASSELALLSEEREGAKALERGLEGTAEKTEEGRPSARQAESGHFSIMGCACCHATRRRVVSGLH